MAFEKKYSYIVVGLALLVSACASTSPDKKQPTWAHLGNTDFGDIKHYISTNTLKRNGSTVSLEVKNILAKPESTSFLKGRKYSYDINQWEVDCKTAKVKLLSVYYYNRDNQLIFSHIIEKPQANTIPRDSILGSVYQYACQNK